MVKKLLFTFLFHLLCFTMLLIPNQYQGPVVFIASGIHMRVLDVTAIFMIILGSILLNVYILRRFWPQIKQARDLLTHRER